LGFGAGLAALGGHRSGVLLLGLLLLLFLAVPGQTWWRGLDVPCGCFGPEDEAYRTSLQIAILRDASVFQ
jgi:hypothetical protein